MVDTRPLKALEYDPKKVELGQVVAPPFDVIPPAEVERLRKKSPCNIVHLTLPKAAKEKDPHAQADQQLEAWIQSGVLKPTSDEAVYAYEIWYTHRHQEKRMRGVVLGLKVDPTYKQVVPHERIFDKPAEDRLKLLRATATDLEPIWLLYSGKSVEETLWAYIDGGGSTPDLLVTGPDGAIHRLWRIMDPAVLGTVVEGLKGRKAYIADGHHRYATAVKYAEERRLMEYRPNRNALYEYKLSLLVNMGDAGLQILPTHRVIKGKQRIDAETLGKSLQADFIVERRRGNLAHLAEEIMVELGRTAAAHGSGHAFALYLEGGGHDYWILQSRENVLPEPVAPGRSFTWRTLDVAFLQKLVVEKHLGVPEERWGDDVYYTRDEQEALGLVEDGKARAAIFHLPTKLAQLRAIADGAEVMPPKSTYFVPKPLSGLVLHRIGKPVPPDPNKRRITS